MARSARCRPCARPSTTPAPPPASPTRACRSPARRSFSVEHARHASAAKSSGWRIISAFGIVGLLLLVYRSFTALALGLLPVLSGALAGVAAVSLGFGSVHGITIGFGTTLIGEAVDYSIYYFVQSRASADGDRSWLQAFWPTIRLGVLTSVCGFAALLFSGFPGLAQLGLYSIAGLVVGRRGHALRAAATAAGRHSASAIPATSVACCAGLLERRPRCAGCIVACRSSPLRSWSRIAIVSGTRGSAASARCRRGAGARRVVAQRPRRARSALPGRRRRRPPRGRPVPPPKPHRRPAERTGRSAASSPASSRPTRFLPSEASQRARQAALPARDELAARLDVALARPAAAARQARRLSSTMSKRQRASPLMTPETLAGSSLGLAVESRCCKSAPTALDRAAAAARARPAADIDAAGAGGAGRSDRALCSSISWASRTGSTPTISTKRSCCRWPAASASSRCLRAHAALGPPRLARVLLPLVACGAVVIAGAGAGRRAHDAAAPGRPAADRRRRLQLRAVLRPPQRERSASRRPWPRC